MIKKEHHGYIHHRHRHHIHGCERGCFWSHLRGVTRPECRRHEGWGQAGPKGPMPARPESVRPMVRPVVRPGVRPVVRPGVRPAVRPRSRCPEGPLTSSYIILQNQTHDHHDCNNVQFKELQRIASSFGIRNKVRMIITIFKVRMIKMQKIQSGSWSGWSPGQRNCNVCFPVIYWWVMRHCHFQHFLMTDRSLFARTVINVRIVSFLAIIIYFNNHF